MSQLIGYRAKNGLVVIRKNIYGLEIDGIKVDEAIRSEDFRDTSLEFVINPETVKKIESVRYVDIIDHYEDKNGNKIER